jgi:transglutaminase-like putative cysteine protease
VLRAFLAAAVMHLRVHHRTHYLYRVPVSDSSNEVRLRPATEDPKRLVSYLLQVQPPVRLRHFRDRHHNYVQWFEMPWPHTEMVVEATSQVHTTTQYPDGARPRDVLFDEMKCCPLIEMLHPFLNSSRYIELEPALWRLALDMRDTRTQVFETAEAIRGHIFREWAYSPLSTNASTHLSEVLVQRRGVCQDFAHLMCGLCRSLGIPARYVSGYIYNGTANELRGAQASHAWCEVWLPGQGWYGLDPTNDTLADERYVKIATGADYDEAAPIRGTFNGPSLATAAMNVQVEVERV